MQRRRSLFAVLAAAAARGWSSSRRRQASPMIPLESSARAITFSDDESAL